jgi:hypothetical protein
MSKTRIEPIKRHGGGVCIPITEQARDLGWKLGDDVRIELDGDKLTITLEASSQ